ncbi:helix-turn-helix domain-containing protein [Halomonas sp. NO4]|uniref:helix-turn-helix transcriptional regulator n=1 Tax=Halomonas sp. NO4 TaxID=2484813 RepID=UPI0013D530DE|nr:helix-turn-helix domain-containing protein [Halomonas sp. NO4]
MKPRDLEATEREARLVALTRQLWRGEISEGALLRTLRREVLRLSQEDYARLVGVSRRTLSDMERGKGNVSIEVMNRVFRPLGLRVGLVPRQAELWKALTPAD